MRTRPVKNVPASVHRRLLNLARSRDTQLNFLLQSYAAERFLYRLGRSPVSDRFTLKGATLFVVWGGETFRGTRDVDLQRWRSPVRRSSDRCRQSHRRLRQATRRLVQSLEPNP